MALDPIRNHAIVTVNTGYDIDDTTIVLASGHGARLPNPATEGAFNLVWWNSTDYKNPSLDPNKEIIRVTARTSDTLTVTRPAVGNSYNGEGSDNVASAKNIVQRQYKMILAPTRAYIQNIQTELNNRLSGVTVGRANASYITDGTNDDVQIQAALDFVALLGGGVVQMIGIDAFQLGSMVTLKPNVTLKGEGREKTTITISASFADGVAFRENSGAADNLSVQDFTLNLSGKADVGGIHVYQGNYSSLRRVRVTGQTYSSSSKWTVRWGNFAEGMAEATASYGTVLEEMQIDNCACGTYEQLLFVNQHAARIVRPYFYGNTNSNAYELMLYINNKNVVIDSPHFRDPNCNSLGMMECDGILVKNVTAYVTLDKNLATIINTRNVLFDGVQAINTRASATAALFNCFDRVLGPDGFSQLVNDTEKCRFTNINVDGWKSTLSIQTIGTVLGTGYTGNHSKFEFNNVTIKNQSVPWNIGVNDVANRLNNFDFRNVRILDWTGTNAGAWQLRGYSTDVTQMYGFRFRDIYCATSTGGGSFAAIRNISMTVETVENSDLSATFSGFGALSSATGGVFQSIRNVKGVNPEISYQQGNITGATTFTRVNGRAIFATLTGNVTATFTAGSSLFSGDELLLILTQDATGSRTITTPSNVVAINGGSLGLSTAANAIDVLRFVWNATTSKWVQTSQAVGKASGAEVNAWTNDTKFITPKAFADSTYHSSLRYVGVIDCSANPNYPAANNGHVYKVSVAGKIGGASGTVVQVGDMAVCTVDTSASGDQATVGANWFVLQANLEIATGAEVDTGTDDAKIVTAKAIRDSGVLNTTISAEISGVTGKTTPVDADVALIEDSAASFAKKSVTWANIKATLKTYFDALYDWATVVHGATGKTTPVDADELGIVDSAASNVLKKVTWANIKATAKTYFDTLYPVYSASAPSAPSNGQMWFNTTLKQMFYYDSTIDSGSWLSVTVYRSNQLNYNASTTNSVIWTPVQAMNSADFDFYIEDLIADTRIATTNDGSNYWSAFLSRRATDNSDTAIANFTTAADTANNYTHHKQSVATFIDVSAVDVKALLLTTTKTSAPGSISGAIGFNYRLVIPK